ncbi:MAG: class I SAM-dependent methyltransferase [Alphaproteobacteria bacterium]|nr:class I SAM-dependent methyltransferase [Alphaproteobacteria bacterium]
MSETLQHSRQAPSPRYQELSRVYRSAHEDGLTPEGDGKNLFAGNSLLPHVEIIRELVRATGARDLLDYGCGKAGIYKRDDVTLKSGESIGPIRDYWGVDSVSLYDPGVAEYSALPERTFDGVVSTDVLEHIPEEDIPWVLGELFGFADKFVFANIASYPATKILPNGWNAHVTVRPADWWADRIRAAAKGWRGQRYYFVVSEKRAGFDKLVGKLTARGKMRLTEIVYP